MAAPAASRNTARVARRGSGTRPQSSSANRRSELPDTRTTPMPARPWAVAMAGLVAAMAGKEESAQPASARSTLRSGRLTAFDHAGDLPLLRDRQDIVHQPVQHEAGRKEEEHHPEGEWHDHHDLRLD